MNKVALAKCFKNHFNSTPLFLNSQDKKTSSMKAKSEKISLSKRSENVQLFKSTNKLKKPSLNCWFQCFHNQMENVTETSVINLDV